MDGSNNLRGNLKALSAFSTHATEIKSKGAIFKLGHKFKISLRNKWLCIHLKWAPLKTAHFNLYLCIRDSGTGRKTAFLLSVRNKYLNLYCYLKNDKFLLTFPRYFSIPLLGLLFTFQHLHYFSDYNRNSFNGAFIPLNTCVMNECSVGRAAGLSIQKKLKDHVCVTAPGGWWESVRCCTTTKNRWSRHERLVGLTMHEHLIKASSHVIT